MGTAASSHRGGAGLLPIQEVIERTLAHAIGTRGLLLISRPELDGASVVGRYFEAYVYPEPAGFQVDVWRPEDDEAMRMEHLSALKDAVAVAIEAVTAGEID